MTAKSMRTFCSTAAPCGRRSPGDNFANADVWLPPLGVPPALAGLQHKHGHAKELIRSGVATRDGDNQLHFNARLLGPSDELGQRHVKPLDSEDMPVGSKKGHAYGALDRYLPRSVYLDYPSAGVAYREPV